VLGRATAGGRPADASALPGKNKFVHKVSVRDSGRGKTKLVRKGRALTVRAR
jgi:hypothetical protein